jgi:ATP-binding cassette, subfamily B, multidrug efflux pump
MGDRARPEQPRKLNRRSLQKLLALLLAHRRALGVGFAGLICVDLLQLILPKISQRVVDRLAAGVIEPRSLWLAGGAVVAVSLGMGACRFVWRYFLMGTSYRIERDLRQKLYDHLQTLSPQYYDRTKVGDVMAHATNDLAAVRMATGMAALAALDSLVLATASITIMLAMSPSLTLLVLIPLPLLTFLMFRFGRIVHVRFTAVQEAFSRLTEKAQESISGIRVVKSYGDEASEERYFADRARTSANENIRLARAWGIFGPLISALASASLAILIGAGGRMVIRGALSLGELVAFTSYLNTLIWPMMAAGWVVNLLQRGTASLDRLEVIFSTSPDVVGGPRTQPPPPALELRGLGFTYPNTTREVLREVSLRLPVGRTLGIVGRTGSGKTTLVELLLRLYDPPAGTIFLDGCDVRELALPTLREEIGYVPQETFLFAMSVADNIAFGRDGLDRAEVERLARLVDIHEEIVNFPQGYDTMVGERGVTLSGGQKQRVAIARALARDPRILILDDALSSVDTATENRLLAALRSGRQGRTNVVIAHRTSTVRSSDLILVLDGGRPAGLGTHEELMQQEGYYRDLHRMQQLEAEAREAVR